MRFVLAVIMVCLVTLPVGAAEKGTANFYQSAPQEYLGKEIRLRVISVSPVPELTVADKGFVWMEAVTGRPKKEEGKILLRVPEKDSAKLAKSVNLPSSPGRWVAGVFSGHESGDILAKGITQRAPYYIQMSSGEPPKDGVQMEDISTASGSLVVPPKTRETKTEAPPATATKTPQQIVLPVHQTKETEGPQVVVLRAKPDAPLQVRSAKSVTKQADFCEIIGQDGKLSLVGKGLVIAVLPLPKEGSTPTKDEVDAALRMYTEKAKSTPEAAALIAEAKASWEKFAATTPPTIADAALPQLEEVETAAGVEETLVEPGYPAWFLWAAVSGFLLLIGLGWIWSRPRSTPV